MVVHLNFLDEGVPGKVQLGNDLSKQLLFFILLLLSGFIVVLCESFLLYDLRKETRSLSEQLRHLEEERVGLDAELARMTDRLQSGEEKLHFILSGAGAAEILSALAFLRTEGMTIDELRLSEKDLVLEGRCESPQLARAFASALSATGLFSSAGEAVIADSGYDGGFSFSFTGETLPLRSIVAPEGQDG